MSKERIEADLALRNLVIEKLLIGALLLLAGYWLNMKLESYKDSLKRNSEVQKERIQAIEDVQAQTGTIFASFSDVASNKGASPDDVWRALHLKLVTDFATKVNSHNLYFSHDLGKSMQVFINYHAAIAKRKNVTRDELLAVNECIRELHDLITTCLRVELGATQMTNESNIKKMVELRKEVDEIRKIPMDDQPPAIWARLIEHSKSGGLASGN